MELGPFPEEWGADRAAQLDAADDLAAFRHEFVEIDSDLIYLDGNSLGRLPVGTKAVIDDVVERQWGDRLIRSWNEGWWELQLRLGALLAPLVGARDDEVMISDSTSVNLFKLAGAALAAREGCTKIVTDDLNFPTDLYVLDGLTTLTGSHRVEIVESSGGIGPVAGLIDAIDQDTALVTLTHTVFKSGYTYDLAEVTEAAHAAGAMVLFDVSHSVGAVPIDLNGVHADLAVGCTYKHLNGGPGSPAFLYVRRDLQDALTNPVSGWWGHENPFAFDLDFRPTSGIRRFHTGTMPIMSLAAIEPALEMINRAGIDRIRAKSVALGGLLIDLYDHHLAPLGFGINTPRDPNIRGSHVSLTHDDAWQITRALIERAAVLPDFREPNNLRLGLSALYQSFTDIHTAVVRMRDVVATGLHTQFEADRRAVT